METQDFWTAFLLTLFATATLLQPMLRYVIVGWSAKRRDIMNGLSPEARCAYFIMFGSGKVAPSPREAAAEFEKLYDSWYGRRYFIVPGLLLSVVGASAVAAVVFSIVARPLYAGNPVLNLPSIAIAAISGAYLWVVDDHIARARRLDFSPADVMWAVLRIVISVPMGYALTAFVGVQTVAPFIAFGIGAFPLSSLASMTRWLVERHFGTEASKSDSTDDVIHLQGIDKAILERLSKEDITTVTQVAYCDPVRLAMRSNLMFNFVTDCMNQALAWIYLEADLNILRRLGLRGALEIKCFMDELKIADEHNVLHARAVAALPLVAAAIRQSPETLLVVFRQIADDPYTVFLRETWRIPHGLEGCLAASSSTTVPP